MLTFSSSEKTLQKNSFACGAGSRPTLYSLQGSDTPWENIHAALHTTSVYHTHQKEQLPSSCSVLKAARSTRTEQKHPWLYPWTLDPGMLQTREQDLSTRGVVDESSFHAFWYFIMLYSSTPTLFGHPHGRIQDISSQKYKYIQISKYGQSLQ
jgi:hypothetical protein